MLTFNTKALTAFAFLGLISFSTQAYAQSEVLTAEPVTLTVANSFTLAQTTPMVFGSFVAVADTAGSATATLTMDPTSGTITPANSAPAQFIVVDSSSATRGAYAISGAAASTTMNVTISNLTDLTCGACSGTPPAIDLTSVTADDSTPTTDGTGAASFNLGAVLTTVAGGNQYTDGSYAGSFDVTVAY